MIYIVKINDTEYEVDVQQGKAEIITTQTIAAPAVSVSAPMTTAASNPVATPSSTGGEPIHAPMPGAILDVKVKVGDVVKSGQVLAILEAMKMENEILAPRDGRVKDLLITKGVSVATGDVLLTLE